MLIIPILQLASLILLPILLMLIPGKVSMNILALVGWDRVCSICGSVCDMSRQGLERSKISVGHPVMGILLYVYRRCDALGNRIGISGH
jgi:hypothetical protein